MKATARTIAWLSAYYDAVDNLRFGEIGEFLHEDCTCVYPVGVVVSGRERVLQGARRGLGALAGTRHEIRHVWEEEGTLIFELEVTYQRRDGKSISRPGMGVFELENDRIREQRLFVDASGVWD